MDVYEGRTELVQYEDAGRFAAAARLLLGLVAVADAVAILLAIRDVQAIEQERAAYNVSYPGARIYFVTVKVHDAQLHLATALLAQVLISVLAAFAFLFWTHRAYRNLPALGATGLRYGTGWAVGSWFVPILNVWRPKQIVNDIWRASDPVLPARASRESWGGRPLPSWFLLWWLLYLASGVSMEVVVRGRGTNVLELDRLHTQTELLAAACAVQLAAALAAAYVVRRATERQRDRARGVGALSAALGPLAWAPERPEAAQWLPPR